MGLLNGKVAIITGSGGGLGRAHALLFSKEGAKVVVNDLGGARDGTSSGHAAADQVVAEIRAAGGEAVANYDSVATYEGGRGILKTAIDAFGRVDILVNNAGILRDKTLLKMDEPMWDVVIAVHLKGTFILSQLCAAHMAERGGGGRIVNTTSIAGLKGNFGQSNYAAAKAGIYALTRVHSLELGKHGITVNALAPVAKTRMTVDIEGVPDDMQPEHISPMALFLASDLAKDVTGRIFGVHGLQLFEYRMENSEGVTRPSGAWTAQEISEKLADITRFGPAATPASVRLGAPAAAPATPADKVKVALPMLPQAFLPDRAAGWSAAIYFAIAGAQDYTLTVKDGKASIGPGKGAGITCNVSVDAETIVGMMEGTIKGEQAFMAGKIKADNLGDLMKFGKAFKLDPAQVKAAMASSAAPSPAAAPAPAAALTPADKVKIALPMLPQAFQPDRAAGWNAALHFSIAGAQDYTLTIKDGAASVAPGKGSGITCNVSVDADTIVGMMDGTVKGEQAFMAGKVKADNLGDMMKFSKAFRLDPAEVKKALAGAGTGAAPALQAAAPAANAADLGAIFAALPGVFLAEKAGGWNGSLCFDAGSASFTVAVKDRQASVAPGKADAVTATVKSDPATLAGWLTGKIDVQKATSEGKLQASNAAALIKFRQMFRLGAELAPKPAAAPTGANRALIGKLYAGPAAFARPEAIRAYALATNDENPAYLDAAKGIIAPPIFVQMVRDVLFDAAMDKELGLDLLRLVHGEQDMTFHQPIRPWDLLTPRRASSPSRTRSRDSSSRSWSPSSASAHDRDEDGVFIRGEKKAGAQADEKKDPGASRRRT
ncbi:MAG: SDR family NAD(P)-dependent oxidoreductase [Acidobacteriota bacterium]